MLETVTGFFAAILSAILPGFGDDEAQVYNGYLEAEYVYVAPSVTGRLLSLESHEGRSVGKGQFLFNMDASKQEAALRAALARIATAEANLANLETGGRDAEIEVIRAALTEARAAQALARTTYERSENLFGREIVTQAKVDADRAALAQADAHVAQLDAQLKVAELPAGRDAQVVAARGTLAAARADADLARSQLADMSVSAPLAGRIEKVYYEAGEVAAAGAPVVSILPPNALKVLFFLPETDRITFAIGDRFAMSCDGCAPGAEVTLTRMASDPQYTPPMIYSRDERQRLVFRAEGAVSDGAGLLPGQPVSLSPRAGSRAE